MDTITLRVRASGNAPCGNSLISSPVSCIAMDCIQMDFEKVQDFSACNGDSVIVFITNLQIPSSNKYIQWNNEPRTLDTLKKFMIFNDTTIVVALGDSSQPLCPSVNKKINIKVNPVPSVTLIHSSADDTLCSGENILFTANPPGYQNYSFLVNNLISQDSVINSFSASGLKDSSSLFVITKDKGCNDTSNSFVFRVLETPAVFLNRTSSGDTLCKGDSIKFEITNTSYTFFSFYRDANLYQSGKTSYLLSDTLSGKVKMTAKGSFPGQCVSALSAPDSFFIQKIPVISVFISTFSDSLCDYDTLTINASPPGYSFYKFFKNGELLQNSKKESLKLYGITEYDSIWIVSGLSGCTYKSEVKRFSVFPTPDLIVSKNKPDSACYGDTVNFAVQPQLYSSYLFFNGDSMVQDSSLFYYTSNLLVNPVGIRVIGKTLTGCISDTSLSVTITINKIPSIYLTKSFQGNQTCEKDTLVFMATPGYDAYEFYNYSIIQYSGNQNELLVYGLKDSATFKVISLNKGCRSLPSNEIPVTVIPNPNALITGDTLICAGSEATFIASGGIFRTWKYGNTGDTLRLILETSDTIWMISDSFFCKSDTTYFLIKIDTIIPLTYAGKDTTICTNTSFKLYGLGGKIFLWSPSEYLDNPTWQSPEAEGLSTSVSFILRTINDACFSLDTIHIFIDRCLNSIMEDKIPQYFTPNGDNTNDLWVIRDIDYFPEAKITILNRWGEVVFRKDNYMNTWDGKSNSSWELPDDTYYYIIDLTNGTKPLTGFIVLKR